MTKVKGPIFTGRTWKEYIKMFNISLEDLEGKSILDCAGGASSFTAVMHNRGFDVKAIDLLYDKSPKILYRKCIEHLRILKRALEDRKISFHWRFYKDPDEMFKERLEACRRFWLDYKMGVGERYLRADLRKMPFPDESFDLVLCSHLLFIYDHRLNWRFHREAINEMVRVCKGEIRIYPLVKENGEKSKYLQRVLSNPPSNVDAKIENVDYIFRPSANEMLRLIKF